jgi:regulator of extracellular matrix RemA (YlzA/DUF370 family)
MDSNHVILSSVQADTITQRLQAMYPEHHLAEQEREKTQSK